MSRQWRDYCDAVYNDEPLEPLSEDEQVRIEQEFIERMEREDESNRD